MIDLADGESTEMKGSGAKPYLLQNTKGVYSCSCPAWRNQSVPVEKRTCKHLRKLRGDEAGKKENRRHLTASGYKIHKKAESRRAEATAASLGQHMGRQHRPERLVDERETRRRPSSMGWKTLRFPTGKPVSCPRLVLRGITQCSTRRRVVDWTTGVSADRQRREESRPE